MKKLVLVILLSLPFITYAQKVDEKKLTLQLKTIIKGKPTDFNNMRGKIKSIKNYDTIFFTKTPMLYSIDTNNYIIGSIYSIYFDPKELKVPVKDLTDAFRKIIANNDFGYGKMELTNFNDQLNKYEYTSKPKKINEEQSTILHIDLRYQLFLSINKEVIY